MVTSTRLSAATEHAWAVARWEFWDHVRSGRLLIIGALCCVLAPLGTLINTKGYQSRKINRDAAVTVYEQALSATTSLSPDSAAIRAFYDPRPLSSLVTGYDQQMPEYVLVGPAGLSEQASAVAASEIAIGPLQLDLLFVAEVILSLLAVLISFDAISGDRESGTLMAVLSQPVRRTAVFLGKFLGGFLVLSLATGLCFLLALLALLVAGLHFGSAAVLFRLTMLFAITLLYASCWAAIGLALSSTGARSRTALVTALATWTALALAARPAGAALATLIRPVTPLSESEGQKARLYSQGMADQETAVSRAYFRALGTAPTKYGIDINQYLLHRDQFVSRIDSIVRVKQIRLRRALRAVDENVLRERESQIALAGDLALISPAALFHAVATGLAGTGPRSRVRFLREVSRYESRVDDALYDAGTRVTVATAPAGTPGRAALSVNRRTVSGSDIPRFRDEPETIRETLRHELIPMILLFSFTAAFLVLGVFLMERLDVRR